MLKLKLPFPQQQRRFVKHDSSCIEGQQKQSFPLM